MSSSTATELLKDKKMKYLLCPTILDQMLDPKFNYQESPQVQVIGIERFKTDSSIVKLWDGANELKVIFFKSAHDLVIKKKVKLWSIIEIDKFSRIFVKPKSEHDTPTQAVIAVEQIEVVMEDKPIDHQVMVQENSKADILILPTKKPQLQKDDSDIEKEVDPISEYPEQPPPAKKQKTIEFVNESQLSPYDCPTKKPDKVVSPDTQKLIEAFGESGPELARVLKKQLHQTVPSSEENIVLDASQFSSVRSRTKGENKASSEGKIVQVGHKLSSLRSLVKTNQGPTVVVKVDQIDLANTSEHLLFTVKNEEEKLSMHCVAFPPFDEELRGKIHCGTLLEVTNAMIQNVVANHAILCYYDLEMVLSKFTNTKCKILSGEMILKSEFSIESHVIKEPEDLLSGGEGGACRTETEQINTKLEVPTESKVPKVIKKPEMSRVIPVSKVIQDDEIPKVTKIADNEKQLHKDDDEDVVQAFYSNYKPQLTLNSLSVKSGCPEVLTKLVTLYGFGHYAEGIELFSFLVRDDTSEIRCSGFCLQSMYLNTMLEEDERLLIKHANILPGKKLELRFIPTTLVQILPHKTTRYDKPPIKISELTQTRRIDVLELKIARSTTKGISCWETMDKNTNKNNTDKEFYFKCVLTDGKDLITAIINLEDMELFNTAKPDDKFRIENSLIKKKSDKDLRDKNKIADCPNPFLLIATNSCVTKFNEHGFETNSIYNHRIILREPRTYKLKYAKFSEIENGKYKKAQPINIIGVVSKTGPCFVKNVNGTLLRHRKLQMKDQAGDTMMISFWKEAAGVTSSVKYGDVVEIHRGNISEYQQKFDVSVNFVSSIWVNPESDEAELARMALETLDFE